LSAKLFRPTVAWLRLS